MAKTQTTREEPSGMTATSIVDALIARGVEDLERMGKSIGMKPKQLETLVDGFRSGFRTAIDHLEKMNAIHVTNDTAPATGHPAAATAESIAAARADLEDVAAEVETRDRTKGGGR